MPQTQVPDQDRPTREELPAPDNFPAGWRVYRLGEGYVATAADGQDVISWFKVPESKLSYACREEEIPQLESIQLGEQTAILLKSADSYMHSLLAILILRAVPVQMLSMATFPRAVA